MKKFLIILYLLLLTAFSFGCPSKKQERMDQEKTPVPVDIEAQFRDLNSFDSKKMVQAAYNLGEMGGRAQSAIPVLIGYLFDDESPITAELEIIENDKKKTVTANLSEVAYEALEKIDPGWRVSPGAKELVPAFIDSFNTGDDFMAITSAKMLGEIGDERAIEPLIKYLDDSILRDDVAMALQKITGNRFGKDKEVWLKWWEDNRAVFRRKK